ncbi:MAG: hypothetical protein RXS42_07130 [Nitrososphaeria archaeon]
MFAKHTRSVTRYCPPGDTRASAGSSPGVSAAEAEPPGPIGPSARALPLQLPRPVIFTHSMGTEPVFVTDTVSTAGPPGGAVSCTLPNCAPGAEPMDPM